jgi:hypothetical protein
LLSSRFLLAHLQPGDTVRSAGAKPCLQFGDHINRSPGPQADRQRRAAAGPGDRIKRGAYEGKEVYTIFNPKREQEAKALFLWACGDGFNTPSREDIHNRVLELTDPKKYAEKQQKDAQKAAEKPADKAADDEDEEAPEAPENLIPTETQTRPAPNWKDVPDGMAALFHEGCKQQPGHSSDMMRDFARQFVWTAAMVKGLVAGIGDSKDGEAAEQALQAMVDEIAEEYSIFPAQELAEAA